MSKRDTPVQPKPGTNACAPFDRERAGMWARTRRYAVPRWMIEEAAERRLAGDWRGACAAAGVDVAFDLAEVARQDGPAIAEALEDDLRHLAPDLLRWHLPRLEPQWSTQTMITPRRVIVLRAYDRPRLRATLQIVTPEGVGGQRLTLRFGSVAVGTAKTSRTELDWSAARHVWDVRHAHELLARHGSLDRAPFFNADGTPRRPDQLPTENPGPDDPVRLAEWITLLHDRGEVERAFVAANVALEIDEARRHGVDLLDALRSSVLALHRLRPELRRLAREGIVRNWHVPIGEQVTHWVLRYFVATVEQTDDPTCPGDGLRLTLHREMSPAERRRQGRPAVATVPLPDVYWRRLPDLELLRAGRLTPDDLHPLVRSALFPARDAPRDGRPIGPPDPGPLPVIRVRCRGVWHRVSYQGGVLHTHDHTEEERRREQALKAFGGKVVGCFAVRQGWTSTGRMPRALRVQRNELFHRMRHGDTPGVLRMLDLGHDPHARDGEGTTLLHLIGHVDHRLLLPRLLAAGLDLEASDERGHTPLFRAVAWGASADVVRALVDAGARTDVHGYVYPGGDVNLAELIDIRRRRDLDFLKERIAAQGERNT
ncbi:ankyrin repeat domain-containing protein [Actinomadura sp. NPDC047616]|uniref:ankyrin repeat domain-containing protein n=1 Tax=Actinomadura sp. NPDC047616 TaxID=3155914 RepID=UPI0033FAA56D